jgi:hypothetical protein
MTTNRGRMLGLTTLVELQSAGGFTLPNELQTAAHLPDRLVALPLAEVDGYGVEQAASDVVHALSTGAPVSLAEAADRIHRGREAGQQLSTAQAVVANARELAASLAIGTAADLYGAVVGQVLQPAYAATLEEAAKHAATLAGHSHDPRALLSAPAPVRRAWTMLQLVADRHAALRQALTALNGAADRHPQQDARSEFVEFRDPHALTGHKPGAARPPRIGGPTDPVERLLWLVGPAQPAQPWLPSDVEQDAAWETFYGDGQEARRQAAVIARHPGAGLLTRAGG